MFSIKNYIRVILVGGKEGTEEISNQLLQFGISCVTDLPLRCDCVQKVLMRSLDVLQKLLLEITDLGWVQFVKVSSHASVDDGNLVFNWHGHVLTLLQQFSQADTSVQQLLSSSIQIGTELSESSHLTILSQLKFHGTSDLLHSPGLSSRSYTRHRQTDVDGWSDTFVKQFSFQENLSISNGDDVGWDVSRHITGLEKRTMTNFQHELQNHT